MRTAGDPCQMDTWCCSEASGQESSSGPQRSTQHLYTAACVARTGSSDCHDNGMEWETVLPQFLCLKKQWEGAGSSLGRGAVCPQGWSWGPPLLPGGWGLSAVLAGGPGRPQLPPLAAGGELGFSRTRCRGWGQHPRCPLLLPGAARPGGSQLGAQSVIMNKPC